MAAFKHLVRYTEGGASSYGDLVESNEGHYVVEKLEGSPFDTLKKTGQKVEVKELLCPIERTPLVICIGLNYRTHAEEAKLTIPKSPAVFYKPADALAGPFDSIPIHPETQGLLDYEGELVIVISKDAKNVSEENALDYVLGFSAGNDVSARNFQLPEVSGGQFCFAKSFDKFAPIGHTITAPSAVNDPLDARITTKVNGVIKQDSDVTDLIFNVRQIISFLTKGTTVRKGTVIMTGTPAGVGYFRKEFLKNGDVVEVEIEGIAKVKNTISFDSE